MIEVSSMDRKELCKIVRPMLPAYVINSGQIFIAQDISTNMFRDEKRIEVYSIKTQEPQPQFPKCNTLKIKSGQYVTNDLSEAEHFFKMKKAQKIKCEYREIKEKYEDYTKFIKENSEYFLV